jgi:AcrR family transcriptional regulator
MSIGMSEPRYQRRKEDRPAEITAAAFSTFVEKGYAGTRVEEVAKRAGVSKGLLYLYFKTKEELFKSVVKNFVVPRLDELETAVASSDLGAEDFFRGPFVSFANKIARSPVAKIVRLLVAEGPKHPDLLQFYWDNVVSRGIAAIQSVIDKGVQSGEFRRSPATEQPLLFVMPVVFSVIFRLLFAEQEVDTDRLIETQVDILVAALKGSK